MIVNSGICGADQYFQINEEILESEQVAIFVDEEAELDDIVGEPMELGVMKWAPTKDLPFTINEADFWFGHA